jgi:hypothetical protein
LLHLLGGNLPNSSPPCLGVYFIRPLSSDSPGRHKPGQIKGFRFESYWLNLPGFLDIVKATKAVALREAELQVEVERQNASRQAEKLKAEQLSKAVVDYEMKVQQANWELYNRQKAAEALLFEQEREAEARRGVLRAAAGGRRGALRQVEGGSGAVGHGPGTERLPLRHARRQLRRVERLPHDQLRGVPGDGTHQRGVRNVISGSGNRSNPRPDRGRLSCMPVGPLSRSAIIKEG